MRKILLSLVMVFAMTALAQNKIELSSMGKYHEFKSEVKTARAKAAPVGQTEKKVGVVVEMNEGYTVGQLEAKVSRIGFDRGTMGKVYVTLEQLEALNKMPEVKHIAFEPTLKMRLDTAAPELKTDIIHQGQQGLPNAFTGKDVIVVIYDGGFDPNHPMFLDANGVSRVKCIITEGEDNYVVINEEEDIKKFTTDNMQTSHGTHVAGIAAGQYVDESIALEGAAPEAHIVLIPYMQVPLADMGNFVGLLRRETGLPVVVNMSLGENSGLHSDKSVTAKLIDKIAADDNVIFCIAAGNEGSYKIVQRKTFASATDVMKSLVSASLDGKTLFDGDVFFEGKGATPFKVTPVIYNTLTNEVLETLKGTTGSTVDESVEDYTSYTVGEALVAITTNIDARLNTETGNYEVSMNYEYISDEELDNTLLIGYIVTVDEGNATTVSAYVNDNLALASKGDDTWKQDYTFDGTINTWACGNNTISVGSYISRLITEPTAGFDYNFQPGEAELGDIAFFSSWGTLYDGRSLPHIIAPGMSIISSINSYNEAMCNSNNSVYNVTKNGRSYYFAGYSGTSMATPSMTGTIALWLEADPTLTVDKARTIAVETAVKDEKVLNAKYPEQYGAGKVDALAGLKRVLADAPTSVKEMNARTGKNIIIDLSDDRTVNVFAADENQLQAILLTPDGRTIGEYSASSNTLDFKIPTAGVYIIKVKGQKSSGVKKVLVK